MKLSNDEFLFLNSQLEITPILKDEELKYIKSAHPQLYYTTKNKRDSGVSLFTENSFIYSLENEKLNRFLSKTFDEPIENIYTIHRLIYGKGGFARKHKDRFTTHKTVGIILSDSFEGGDMYINDKKVEMRKKGDFIIFNGGTDSHEVKEITYGFRDVLIVWFSKKKSKFSLI